jgi:transposase
MSQRIDIFEEVKKLRQELEHERKLRKQWQERCHKLEKENKELKQLLSQFLNSNTPSSQLPFSFKSSPNREPKGTNPRGKPLGSNGATREEPEKIDEKTEVKAKKCPNGHRKIKQTDRHIRIVYEIGKIQIKTKQFTVYEYACEKCNLHFEATHPELPQEGIFGPNLQAFLTEIRHNFAGSYGKISMLLENLTGTAFSPQGIKDCIHRVAENLEPSYKQMEEEISQSKVVHSDETSWPVDGKDWWLWLLCTLNTVFITINQSRARKVITGILGDYFDGVVVSDCLQVYRNFASAYQRCWSHLLRKTHFEKKKAENKDIVKLHEQLTILYKDVNKFLEASPSFEQRVWNAIMYNQKLQRIANYRWKSNSAKSITENMLKGFDGQWLVGVIMPEVELTNNKDERGIRKVIPHRKLLGGHRTKQGAYDFAVIESHRQTWRLRNESPYNKLVDYLMDCNVKTAS